MKSNILFSALLLGTLILPSASQAYSVTDTSAKDLGNGYALFTVTYKFGFLNREMYMPIEASRNTKFTDKGSDVKYSILFNDQTEAKATSTVMKSNDQSFSLNYSVLPGKAKAIVVSDADIKDNQYYLPKGKSQTFTLVALVDMRTASVKDDISLQITSLPFTMVDGRKQTAARLSAEELESYKTSEISLK
ncbi:hypothetical protein K2P47_01880 [Patescibacteria group bacterium]|nr:hypothetical protein [Patescibacteria group bacterium]